MRISGLVVSAPDVTATREAWSRLDVGVGIEVVPGESGLAGVVLSVEDVAATARLLERRDLEVSDAVVGVHGTTWHLREAGDTSPTDALALDHVVVTSPDAVAATADFGGRLGLDLRLDRDTDFGFRGLFFRCGDAVVEVVVPHDPPGSPFLSGAAWRCADVAGTRSRLAGLGVEVSETRRGRKPGTSVATVRDPDLAVPTLLVGPDAS